MWSVGDLYDNFESVVTIQSMHEFVYQLLLDDSHINTFIC